MKKVIYSIGDSFTFRGPQYKSWSYFLSNKLNLLDANNGISGSSNDGTLLVRDSDNTVLIFEDPYTGELPHDPSTKIIHSSIVNQLKDDEASINSVLDRDFEEF